MCYQTIWDTMVYSVCYVYVKLVTAQFSIEMICVLHMWRYFIRGFTNPNNLLGDLHVSFIKLMFVVYQCGLATREKEGENREGREGIREGGREGNIK